MREHENAALRESCGQRVVPARMFTQTVSNVYKRPTTNDKQPAILGHARPYVGGLGRGSGRVLGWG